MLKRSLMLLRDWTTCSNMDTILGSIDNVMGGPKEIV